MSRSAHIERAGELQNQILYQVRTEKNLILASSDAEVTRITEGIRKFRKKATRIADEIKAMAVTPTGKKVMEKFSSSYEKMNSSISS